MANSETLRAASGSLGSVNSASMENNSMETPFLATWNHQHGKNVAMQDLSTSELLRTSHSPSHSRNAKRNSRRSRKGPCRLHSRAINVQDLGLGYQTEEVVLFKYCSGSCDSYPTNYDQVLNYIIQKGLVPIEKNFISKPCCRPVLFENFSFLDIYNVWQNVEKGSAAKCGCVG